MNSTYTKKSPLLMIPGPSPVSPRVLQANTRALSHTEPEFIQRFNLALQNTRKIFGTDDTFTPVVISGSGTLAMEISVVNLINTQKRDKALIFSSGYFGIRFQQLLNNFQISNSLVESRVGQKFTEQEFEESIKRNNPKIAYIQHVDTSTGVANDISTFSRICQENEVISVVDGVCAVGGEAVYQKKWGVDLYFTGAQKALETPPGLAILNFSEKARELIENNNAKPPSYYSNLDNWWPVIDAYLNESAKYFSTPATNLINSYSYATEIVLKEGLESRYTRHKQNAELFRTSLEELGFNFLTHDESYASTLSTPYYPEGVDGNNFRQRLLDLGLMVAGGLQGGYASKYFRVGHMGRITKEDIEFAVQCIKRVL